MSGELPQPTDVQIEAAAKAMWANDRTWETIDATNRSIHIAMATTALKAAAAAGSDQRLDACEHLSATGISQYDGPEKVWRCDGCGWLYVNRTTPGGITHMLDVEDALVAAMDARAAAAGSDPQRPYSDDEMALLAVNARRAGSDIQPARDLAKAVREMLRRHRETGQIVLAPVRDALAEYDAGRDEQ